MSRQWKVVCVMLHQTKPEILIDSGKRWDRPSRAIAWMNGNGGEMFSQEMTIDVKTLDGYWTDEIVAVPEDDPEWTCTGFPPEYWEVAS